MLGNLTGGRIVIEGENHYNNKFIHFLPFLSEGSSTNYSHALELLRMGRFFAGFLLKGVMIAVQGIKAAGLLNDKVLRKQ